MSTTHSEFLHKAYDEKWCIQLLISYNIFKEKMECPICCTNINLNVDTLAFRCGKRSTVMVIKKKRKSVTCGFFQSVKSNTWFHFVRLPISTALKFIAHFLWIPVPRYNYICEDLGLSAETIVNWSSYCRELCVYWTEHNSQKLGGPGVIVEIDEAKFGKRKYNRGRLITGKWVFGGYERGTKKIFLVPVEDRTADTLLSCIKEWILPGTTIMSDKWKAYNCLSSENYKHLSVNHSINFVDPDTGAHTQAIERTWREVRSNISKYGTKEPHLISYLAEYLFKRAYSCRERIHAFFQLMKEFQEHMIADNFVDESLINIDTSIDD
jgi:transposase-like protein